MPAIWRNPSSRWRRGPRRSNWCRAACGRAGRRTARRGHRSGPQLGQGVSRGRHGRVAARKQERRPSQQASDATGSGRRRRRGPAPQGRGAGTGERVDAGGGGGRRKKTREPACGACRTGEDASDRPSAPDVFAQPDDMLARHRAGQPPTAATPGSGLTDTPGCVSGRPRRSPAPGDLADRDFTAGIPNGKWPADITRDQSQGWEGPCLSPMIDCHDGRIVAYTAGSGPNAGLADRMLAKAAETLPEGAGPLVHSDRGWPLPVARMAGSQGPLRSRHGR